MKRTHSTLITKRANNGSKIKGLEKMMLNPQLRWRDSQAGEFSSTTTQMNDDPQDFNDAMWSVSTAARKVTMQTSVGLRRGWQTVTLSHLEVTKKTVK